MPLFLRKLTIRRDALPVTMSGVRLGERALQFGIDDPLLSGTIALKAGLTGHAAIVVLDDRAAERARAGAAEIGALVDVQVAPPGRLPFADAAFDVVVVHSRNGFLAGLDGEARSAALAESYRVLRNGGRIIILEPGTPVGLARMLGRTRQADPRYEAAGGTMRALEAARFKSARTLADREGYRFIEGLKT
jgi:SAM-dependent methyltransferase